MKTHALGSHPVLPPLVDVEPALPVEVDPPPLPLVVVVVDDELLDVPPVPPAHVSNCQSAGTTSGVHPGSLVWAWIHW
jgi:hypothetical protein